MKKGKKHKLFSRRMAKRMTALIMVLVMAFSSLGGAASSASAKTTLAEVSGGSSKVMTALGRPSLWKRFKTRAVASLTAYGKHEVIQTITRVGNDIDEAAGNDVASSIGSWVKRYVLGDNSVMGKLIEMDAKLDVIIDLCNQILDELDHIEKEMGDLKNEIVTTEVSIAKTNLDASWRSDGNLSYVSSGKYSDVGTAMDAFLEYLEAAMDYRKAVEEGDKNKIEKAEDLLTQKETVYENKLVAIYANRNSLYLGKEIKDDMFVSTDVNTQIVGAIEDLTKKLCGDGNTDTYTDYAAQYASLTRGFTDMQYEFIKSCMDRQLLQICSLEIMYQDYLSRQSEYLQDNYGNDAKKWSDFETKVLEPFAEANANFCNAAGERMEQRIRFSASDEVTVPLSVYITSADAIFYEDDRDEDAPPVIQKGVLNRDGSVSAYWLTKSTQDEEKGSNDVLKGMGNFERALLYTGGFMVGRYRYTGEYYKEHAGDSLAYLWDGETGIKNGERFTYLTAGDLVFTKLFGLYPDNLEDYSDACTYYTIKTVDHNIYFSTMDCLEDPMSSQLWSVSDKLHSIHEDEYNCGAGAERSTWVRNMFSKAYDASGVSPQAYLQAQLGEESYLMEDAKDKSAISRLYASSVYLMDDHTGVAGGRQEDDYWYFDYKNLEEMMDKDDVSEVKGLQRYYHLTSETYWKWDGVVKLSAEEDFLDAYCYTPYGQQEEQPYKQTIRLKNTKSAELVGTDENSQVNAGDTVTLKFDKKQGDKVPMAVKYYQYNGMGDNYSDSKLYQNGEIVVDYDEMRAMLQDDSEDQVEIEFPVHYDLNAAYEVIYEEPVGDVENLEVSPSQIDKKFTLSFDKIADATKAAVYVADDKEFKNVVLSDIIDIEKDFRYVDRITKNYSLKVYNSERLYMRVVGYAEREYGIVYGTAITWHSLLTPVVEAAMVSAEGDVEVRLSHTGEDVGSYQIQVSDDSTFTFTDRLIEKTIDGEVTATFRLESNKYYYIRAREQSWDAGGNPTYGGWSNKYIIFTGISYDNIEKIEVLEPSTSVRVTAEQSQDPLCEGYRFVAYSEDVLERDVMNWFSEEAPEIGEEYKNDVKYKEISKTEELVCVFEDLSLKNWYFFVEIYSSGENGQHIYSNKTKEGIDIAEVNLRPHVKIDEIELTDVDELTVRCSGDYVSTNWKVQIIELAYGNRVCAEEMSSTDNLSLTLKVPRENNLEVRVTSWREDPDTGETVEGRYKSPSGASYDSQTLDLALIPFFNVVGDGWIRAKFGKVTGYTAFEYELYQGDTLLKSGEIYPADEPLTTEPMGVEAVMDFKNLSEGKYRLAVKPYVKKTSQKEYGEGQEISLNYGPPEFEGAILLDPLEATDIWGRNASMPLAFLASTGEAGDAMPDHVAIEVSGPLSSFKEGDYIYDPMGNLPYETTISGSYNETYKCFVGKVSVHPENTVKFSMRSFWKSLDGTQWIYSKKTGTQSIDLGNTPKYSDFSEWLESHRDEVSVDIVEDTSSGLKQTPKAGTLKKAGTGSSKKKYLVTVSLPENMEHEEHGRLDFDGITVRLTTDEEGQNVIAAGYEKGRKLVISQLSDGNVLEADKSYYVWISLFNYGDDEEKVRLNAGYAGPYEVNTSPSNTDDSGQAAPGTDAGTTPAPDSGITGNATPSGLSVGEKATAGKGAAKAVYKATGKNTVTYVKSKAGKYAGTVTVPATVKINGKKYKVTKIAKSAFQGYESLRTVLVKPTGLTKKKVTGCLKGTSVETVQVPKKQYKKYKKVFTKKVTKSKVKVTVKKNK